MRIKNYVLKQIIGEGATGTVYRAVSDADEEVAVKVIPKREKCIRMAHRELEVLGEIRHENVVRLVGQFESSRHIYVVEELCDFNLISFLSEYEVDENIALKVLRMILCAVRHLHMRGIIHRDIKLGNVLLKENTAKICDFGLSCYQHENNNTFCGTMDYIAPEIVNKQEYSSAVDMWSVGVIFYVLLTKRKYSVGVEDPCCSEEALDLLHRLLDEDGVRRIGAEEALEHRCFDRFVPECQDFRHVPDFEKTTRFGVVRKRGDEVGLNGIRVVMRKEGAEAMHADPRCECGRRFVYSVLVDGVETSTRFLTNSELKMLSLVGAYVKMLREKTAKIVIEENGGRFHYTLSGDFMYAADLLSVKSRNGMRKVEGEGYGPEVERVVCLLEERCRRMDKEMCWSSVAIPVLINCANTPSLSMSCVSQVSEMGLRNRAVYRFLPGIGWCIRTNGSFLFLLSDGERFEVLREGVVVHLERRQRIGNGLPRSLKRILKRVCPLLKMFIDK